jgi:hypothetical protein
VLPASAALSDPHKPISEKNLRPKISPFINSHHYNHLHHIFGLGKIAFSSAAVQQSICDQKGRRSGFRARSCSRPC